MQCLGVTLYDTSSWHLVLQGVPCGLHSLSVYYMPILNYVQVIVEVRVEPRPPTSQEVPWWAIAVTHCSGHCSHHCGLYRPVPCEQAHLYTPLHMYTHACVHAHTHTCASSSTVSVPSLVSSNVSVLGMISKLLWRKTLLQLMKEKEVPLKEKGLPLKEKGLPVKEKGLPLKEKELPLKEKGLPVKEKGVLVQERMPRAPQLLMGLQTPQ